MIVEMKGEEFTNDNYSPYGGASQMILHGEYENILGYTYDPLYYVHEGYGGVMIVNQFGSRVWNEVKESLIDKLKEEEDI